MVVLRFKMLAKKLADVTLEEWSHVGQLYASIGAVLVTRAVYVGESVQPALPYGSDSLLPPDTRTAYVFDDWTYKHAALMLFKVTGILGNGGHDVVLLRGQMIPEDRDDVFCGRLAGEVTLDWCPATFSWRIFMPELAAMDLAFTSRGLRANRPHAAYLDVPFGHLVGIGSMGVSLAESVLNTPFVTTSCHKLGDLGTQYSANPRLC